MAEFTASIWFSYEAKSYKEANDFARQISTSLSLDSDVIDVELIDGEVPDDGTKEEDDE